MQRKWLHEIDTSVHLTKTTVYINAVTVEEFPEQLTSSWKNNIKVKCPLYCSCNVIQWDIYIAMQLPNNTIPKITEMSVSFYRKLYWLSSEEHHLLSVTSLTFMPQSPFAISLQTVFCCVLIHGF